jgi:hypothetical protein
MGGTDQTSTTQSQQTTQLPPWVNTAAQQNYGFAQNVATQPLQQYQGQMVADVAPQTQQAWNTAASGGNAGQQQYNAAQAGYLGVMGQQPQQVTPGQLSSTNLQPYMNPYTQSVINATLPIMQQNLGLSQNQNQDQAAAANAFGGSRQAVRQGVTQAQGAQGMAQMAAQLNQANYGQAQGAAQQDIATNLQGQLANQAVQQNQAGLNLQASSGMGALGNAAQQSQLQNYGEQLSAGGMEQQQAQNEINANMAAFQQAQQYPYMQLGVLQSALGMTPYGNATQGQTVQQVQSAPNYLQAATSGLQMLGGLFSAPAGGTSAMTGASNFFGGLSDRRLKTDITKVGRHPLGINIHAYRYKGDPKTYPKVVGPMAEDVAKKFGPAAVAEIPGSGGKMAVHPAVMGALAAPISRRPMGLMPGPRGGAGPPGRGPPGFNMGPPVAGPRGMPTPSPAGGMGPPVPGALTGPGVAGAIGALGASMRPPPRPQARRPRMGSVRGALGG